MLRNLAPDLWVAEQPLKLPGLRLSARMTVVRLPDGRLWLHSPIRLVPELKEALDALGPVAFAVGPNRFHHLFLRAYGEAYPNIRLFAAPGLERKRPDLRFAGTLGSAAEPDWADVIDQHPMAGAPRWGEVEFYHRPSHTLILTDLLFNVRQSPHWGTRFFLRLDGGYGKPAVTRLVRALVKDKTGFRESLRHLLAWDFERITLAHGEVVDAGGKEIARAAFAPRGELDRDAPKVAAPDGATTEPT